MPLADLFKKKKEPELPPAEAFAQPSQQYGPLTQEIIAAYRQQGYADDQIIEALTRQGYTAMQVQDVLNEFAAQGPEPLPPPVPDMRQMPSGGRGVEEVAESIIEEKWHELQGDLAKFNEWKDKTDSRLDKLEQSFSDLRQELESLHKGILSKITDYDRNLLDVGTEIKAMERVFQKVLPELSSNIQELGRITKRVKEEKEA